MEPQDPSGNRIIRVPISAARNARTVGVVVDPGRDDLLAIFDAALGDGRRETELRGIEIDGRYYFWDGFHGAHGTVGAAILAWLRLGHRTFNRISVARTVRGFSCETYDAPPQVFAHVYRLLYGRDL